MQRESLPQSGDTHRAQCAAESVPLSRSAGTWPARHPCSPSQPAPPATTAPATALLGSSYLSRAPPQQQPQNSRSVPDQCRQRQVDVLAIPHKLRQAGAATGMAHRLQPDVMAVMLAMVRNLGAQPVAHQRRREKPPSWPSDSLKRCRQLRPPPLGAVALPGRPAPAAWSWLAAGSNLLDFHQALIEC